MAQGEPLPSSSQPEDEEGSGSDPGPLDCVVCFTQYDRIFKLPKALGCGHVFCLECLARISVSTEDVGAITCPVCRAPTSVPPRKGLPALPTRQDLLEQLPLAPAPCVGSVRFSRRRGLLYLPGGDRNLPKLASPMALSTISLSVDVGRPVPRHRCWPVRLSGWPFYVALTVVLVVVVGLIICGIYIFLLPSLYTVTVGSSSSSNSSRDHLPTNKSQPHSLLHGGRHIQRSASP